MSTTAPIDGIVVGVQAAKTSASSDVIQKFTSVNVPNQWASARTSGDEVAGQVRVFYPPSSQESVVAAVSLPSNTKPAPANGPDKIASATTFLRNEQLEHTRTAAAKGVRALRGVPAASPNNGQSNEKQRRAFAVDQLQSPHAAATGAGLALWKLNHFKTRGDGAAFDKEYDLQGGRDIDVVPLQGEDPAALLDQGDEVKGKTIPLSWQTGKVYAEAQNWARELKETPANLLTPTIFCKLVEEKFKGLHNVSLVAHDEAWARSKSMGSFISVTQGTEEPAKMLEIQYKGGPKDAPTVGLVGKGITFDSGGISIKPGAGMKAMRADMGGAAAVVSTVYALAKLQVPVNIVCVTPLTENMPSGHATKPGDLVKAMNGLTIDIDNTGMYSIHTSLYMDLISSSRCRGSPGTRRCAYVCLERIQTCCAR